MENGKLRVLSLSDKVVPFIYSPQVRHRFQDVNLLIGCGDLPYFYLEYVLSMLDAPLYFVRGNHDKVVEYSSGEQRTAPCGGFDLHRRTVNHDGLLLAGVDGCQRYRPGPFQYTQAQMWQHVWSLAPALFANRLRHGRFLDVFVTHAPPTGVHDAADLPHRGIAAFRWLLNTFKPAYHFHGHIHTYRPDTVSITQFGATRVVNAFGFQEMVLEM